MRLLTAACRTCLLCWAALTAAAPAWAQADGRGVATLTRYVQLFGQLERDVAEAHSRHDTATLDRLVSNFFEVRRSDAALLAREDWVRHKAPARVALVQLAVHEVGEQAIASFIRREASGRPTFVVDVWSPQPGGTWQLRLRFESPGATQPAAHPPRRKAPDGKG